MKAFPKMMLVLIAVIAFATAMVYGLDALGVLPTAGVNP